MSVVRLVPASLVAASLVVAMVTVPAAVAAPKRPARSVPPPPPPPLLPDPPSMYDCAEGQYTNERTNKATGERQGIDARILYAHLEELRLWKGGLHRADIRARKGNSGAVTAEISFPGHDDRWTSLTVTCIKGRLRIQGERLGSQILSPGKWDAGYGLVPTNPGPSPDGMK